MQNLLKSKIIVSMGLICVFVLMIQGLRFFVGASNVYSAEDVKREKMKGSPSAKLKIVEYSDFQCPSCSNGAKIINDLFKKYPDDISIEFNAFPLTTIHPHALTASVFAECAARQNQFWAFHDFVFETQKDWARREEVRSFFLEKIKELDIKMVTFKTCIEDPSVSEAILADKAKIKATGVHSTPTFYLNDKMVVGTKRLETEILKILEGEEDEAN